MLTLTHTLCTALICKISDKKCATYLEICGQSDKFSKFVDTAYSHKYNNALCALQSEQTVQICTSVQFSSFFILETPVSHVPDCTGCTYGTVQCKDTRFTLAQPRLGFAAKSL